MAEKKQRGGYRTIATKQIAAMTDILEEDEVDIIQLKAGITELRRIQGKMLDLDEKIQQDLEDDTLIVDMEESSRRNILIEVCLAEAMDTIQKIAVAKATVNTSPNIPYNAVKLLPQLHLPTCNGDPIQWTHFWDSFESAVHNRSDISGAHKFTYLRGQLRGEAQKLLEGFALTNDQYDEAVKLLRETYGNEKRIIQAHLCALFDLASPAPNSQDLCQFRAEYECHLRGLTSLKVDVDSAGYVFATLLIRKLPNKLRDNLNRATRTNYWELQAFREAVNKEIDHLQVLEPCDKLKKSSKKQVDQINKNKSNNSCNKKSTIGSFNVTSSSFKAKSVKAINSNENKFKTCRLCPGEHTVYNYNRYTDGKMRMHRAKELKLCMNCLNKNHAVANCNNPYRCQNCKLKHHTALCFKNLDTLKENKMTEEKQDGSVGALSVNCSQTKSLSIALPTAMLTIQTNKDCKLRAMFDQRAQRTLILKAVVSKLRIKTIKTIKLSINGYNTKGQLQSYDLVNLMTITPNAVIDMEAIVVEHLLTSVSTPGLNKAVYALKSFNIQLADPEVTDQVKDISVLIGADNYYKFVTGYSKHNGIHLLHSKVGAMVTGNIGNTTNMTSKSDIDFATVVTALHIAINEEDLKLDQTLQNFWLMDAIGINSKRDSEMDDTLQEFDKTVRYEDGRYVTLLPWKKNHPPLSTNFGLARSRLNTTLKQLRADPERLQQYDAVITQQLEKGFIEIVTESSVPKNVAEKDQSLKSNEKTSPSKGNKVHYLAHHGVRKDSSTTPLRIVFDCSAGSPSLNDCLHSGPSLIEDLSKVLLRFRLDKYACVGDIAKAFLMIGLDERDRDCTRFLWVSNPSDPSSKLIIYRYKVVLFGSTCSQFLLNATVRCHLKKYDSSISSSVMRNLYVDNLQGTSSEEADLIKYYNQSKSIMRQANLHLQEWSTNSPKLKALIVTNGDGEKTPSEYTNILGMKWYHSSDNVGYPLKKFNTIKATKRSVLSNLASIYDPLGYLLPVTIKSRIFMQELWKQKLSWDEVLKENLVLEWEQIAKDIQSSLRFELPRQVATKGTFITIHAFSDASMKAYGSSIYFLNQNCTHLVMAKARVAPIKELTIPQLELTAATLTARLVSHVIDAYKEEIKFTAVYAWCDSKIVLNWLKTSKVLKPYVRNRVTEINKLVPTAIWNYVPTADNPSDIISRGIGYEQFMTATTWITGPTWLLDPTQWPEQPNSHEDDSSREVAANTVSEMVEEDVQEQPLALFAISSFNKLSKIIKVTSLVKRFIHILKKLEINSSNKDFSSHNLSIEELNNSLLYWVKHTQKKEFQKEINYLESKSNSNPPNLVRQLRLILDNGLLRCHSRLEYADLSYDTRNPILLPSSHHLTNLIVENAHREKLHAGASDVVASLRQMSWIPHMRQRVKVSTKACIICKRLQGSHYKDPPFPSLPLDRIRQRRPFEISGVDYTGALSVREKGVEIKMYICLFTCAVTRAVHLEMVDDLTAASFCRSFRRFIGRRGCPQRMYSDNATTFVLSAKIIQHPSIQQLLTTRNCQWKFIPSRAPWFGGFWERLIGLTKNAIKRMLGRAFITADDLRTLIVEIESRLNDRPLTYASGDLEDQLPLTPSQLILGHRLDIPSKLVDSDDMDEDFELNPALLQKRQRQCNIILQRFWHKWKSEYLLALRQFHQHGTRGTLTPNVGDVVLIHEDKPRINWALGLITELVKGTDGNIRSAYLKTKKGILSRPIVKLYPLEISSNSLMSSDIKKLQGQERSITSMPKLVCPRKAKTKAIQNIAAYYSSDSE